MENRKKGVWIGEADLSNDSAFIKGAASQEFYELPIVEQLAEEKAMEVGTSRRDFLKYMGFGLGAATVAASCEVPVKRAIPYVVKPDAIVPGVATYYASSYVKGGDYCPVIVKTREGRPIKIEGNSLSAITNGGTSARAQAMVLELYDTSRFQGPAAVVDGKVAYKKEGSDDRMTWADLDQALGSKMNAGAKVRIITNTVLSPTTKQVFQEFKNKYPNTEVVTYDPVSASAILEANQESFGQAVVPNYMFDKADVIVSFGADFLGTWISPVEYTRQYTKNRVLKDVSKAKMSRHVQVESYMSLTGSNADNRILIKPSEQGAAIALLANEIIGGVSAPAVNEKATAGIKRLAAELKRAQGRALVVSGSNNVGEQVLVNAINNALNSYGNTISFENASMQRQGMDKNIQNLIKEMNGGGVDVVFVADGANPAYDLPNSAAFAEAFAKVGTRVTFSGLPNETAAQCTHIAPTHHTLESWGDAEPKRGMYSLIQPTIAPLWKTRQMEESLLRWSGSANLNADSDQPYFDYLRATWQRVAFSAQNKFSTFQAFWDSVLHDGVFNATSRSVVTAETASAEPVAISTTAVSAFAGNVATAASRINKPSSSELEVTFYETVNIGGGEHASNPWLQEMPDPVMRTVWSNYLAVPVQYNGGNTWDALKGLNPDEIYSTADKTKVTVNGVDQVCVAIRQFGQPQNTVAIGLGYGREVTGQVTEGFGVNVYPWLSMDANGNTMYYAGDVNVSTAVGKEDLACVQYHHTMGVTSGEDKDFKIDEQTLGLFGAGGFQGSLTKRSIIRQTNLSELK
ncbi:MAG: TAT-variant-translocated molybdopterin oxidoreductase, partial [Saprospiraceae bacterium]